MTTGRPAGTDRSRFPSQHYAASESDPPTSAPTRPPRLARRRGGAAVGGRRLLRRRVQQRLLPEVVWLPRARRSPEDDAGAGHSPGAFKAAGAKQASSTSSSRSTIIVGRSLIRTAAVSLRSSDISSVLTKIDQLVARDGGFLSSENTATDEHGVAVRSSVDVAVPIDDFDSAYNEVASYGDLVSKSAAARDVTAQVIDVDSRVTSAHDSIAQLRLLFDRATKLGDVIALERELSQREADLEALQSQQRDLRAQTTMSTISVDVSSSATAQPTNGDNAGGFLSGIRQGWHGMVAFVVAFAHLLGLVLPLGALALAAGLISWVSVRRFTPRRPPRTSE